MRDDDKDEYFTRALEVTGAATQVIDQSVARFRAADGLSRDLVVMTDSFLSDGPALTNNVLYKPLVGVDVRLPFRNRWGDTATQQLCAFFRLRYSNGGVRRTRVLPFTSGRYRISAQYAEVEFVLLSQRADTGFIAGANVSTGRFRASASIAEGQNGDDHAWLNDSCLVAAGTALPYLDELIVPSGAVATRIDAYPGPETTSGRGLNTANALVVSSFSNFFVSSRYVAPSILFDGPAGFLVEEAPLLFTRNLSGVPIQGPSVGFRLDAAGGPDIRAFAVAWKVML